MASEEAKVIEAENSTEVLTAFNRIPYALINAEIAGTAKDTLDELTQICKYYKVYKKGAGFTVEGTNGIRKLYRDWETDRKSTRLNSSHSAKSRMPSSA